MEVVRENERELDTLTHPKKVHYLMEKHLKDARMFLKGFDPPFQTKMVHIEDSNRITVQLGDYVPEIGEELTLFRILGRYMHLKGTVEKNNGSGGLYTLKVSEAAIARKNRDTLRIPIRNREVFISNIRTSKHTIDASLFNIPTSVKVNFGSYEQSQKALVDYIKIDVFGKKGTIFDEVRKSGKPLYLADTQNPDSYQPVGDAFVDYADFLDDDLQATINNYRNQKVKSEIISPIVYLTHDNSPIPLGYIHIQSHSEHYSLDKVSELEKMAEEMVERIRDSNTVMIQDRQSIINLSAGGIKILVDHDDLKRYLQRMNGFTFDLFFRGQAPITLYGMIRSSYTDRSGDLILGVQISGSSSRKGEVKRFQENVKDMEARVRAELAQRQKLAGK